MLDADVKAGSVRSILTLLIFERFFHAIGMGAATLLPFYFIRQGLDEVYFGATSAISAVVAVLLIVSLPRILKFVAVNALSLVSGFLLLAGYSLLLYADLSRASVAAIGYFSFPLISSGWVLHFTLGSMKVSAVSTEDSRQQNFMVYAAFSTMGVSSGPIVSNTVLDLFDHFRFVFIALLAFSTLALMFSVLTWRNGGGCDREPTIPDLKVTPGVFMHIPATFFIVMIFFLSGIFTVIINFQVVFGERNNVDSSLFFLCWAAGIMGPRLMLGGWIATLDNRFVLPVLSACLALALFLLAAGPWSDLFYGATAVMLGVFYGLSYPIVQAETVRFSPPAARRFFLVAFSLAYFIAFYATPLAAGAVVVRVGYNRLFALAGLVALLMAISQAAFYGAERRKRLRL